MIELAAGDVRAIVDPAFGGRIASLVVDGAERLQVEPRDDIVGWGCFAMAPFAGRIRDAVLRWDGTEHRLRAEVMPPHAIHGTVLDRAWSVEHAAGDVAQLATELGAGWPWPGRVVQRVRVEPGTVVLDLEVQATGDPFPATCGFHPWFAGAEVDGALPVRAMYRRDAAGLPDGTLVDPAPPPWDDCFTDLRWPVAVRFTDGLRLEVSSTADHVVVYTAEEATCVEPQSGPPDAPHLGLATVVAPGAPLALRARFAFQRP